MGKPSEDDRRHPADLEAGNGAGSEADTGSSFCCCCFQQGEVPWIARAFTLRCVVVFVLSVCVFLSALFWLPPFRAFRSGRGHSSDSPVPIEASFILQRPLPFLSMHTERLEYDIFEEIGVPDTKVSVISMHSSTPSNSTYVVFGVLPDSKHATYTMNSVILSVLRSSLIELVLQQSNLSLTPSIFGQPSFFEILKFPGGITIIPVQSAPIWQIRQNLFNFTLNYSIIQILKNLDELKGQLKYGLNLKYHENVYVQMTNLHGSTIEPSVIVEASVLSDVGSRNLLPPRLKQLAKTITGSPAKNLGLNHTVFGKVKGVVLSSYLNHSITLSEAPSPSPSPADMLPTSAPPTLVNPFSRPSHAPLPSTHRNNSLPCLHCSTSPPPQTSPSYAPVSDGWLQPPSSQSSSPPSPLVAPPARSPRRDPCFLPAPPPDASPSEAPQSPISSGYSSQVPAPSQHKPPGPTTQLSRGLPPAPLYHSSSHQATGGDGSLMSPLSSTVSFSPTPFSNFAVCSTIDIWLLGFVWFASFNLL